MSAGVRKNQAAKVSLSNSSLKDELEGLVFCCIRCGDILRTAILSKCGRQTRIQLF